MRSLGPLVVMAIFTGAIGHFTVPAPECATLCWENTKYISKCLGDHTCLCKEAEYQKAVFQCLYSQCDTSHFGIALHHAISQCLKFESELLLAFPPIPNRELLRRREAEYTAGIDIIQSGSASAYFGVASTSGFPTQSTWQTMESARVYRPNMNPAPFEISPPFTTSPPVQTLVPVNSRSITGFLATDDVDETQTFTGPASTPKPGINTFGIIVGFYLLTWWYLRR